MKIFIKDMLERAIKTAAQSALAVIGASHFISEIDWLKCLSAIAFATLLSVLTSVSSFRFGDKGTASAVKIETEENLPPV